MFQVFVYSITNFLFPSCCERSDGTLSWSLVKVTKECIKAASDSEYASDSAVTESEIALSNILCTTYECKNGSPGFNLEMVDVDEQFWLPVACRTCSRSKPSEPPS